MSGATNGFLAKYNPTGTPLVYSTYIGGSSTHNFYTENHANGSLGLARLTGDIVPTNVVIRGLAVDNNGNAYITGSTDGDFYYTFGSYSVLGTGTTAIPGEDYPAPATTFIPNPDPTQPPIREPSESQPNIGQEIDDHDAVIAKIADNSPLITSPLTALGSIGKNFGYNITATNSPSSYNAAGLPPGLSINTATGTIAGIPTLEGNYNVVLTATNASGTGAQILFLNISSAKPNITNALSASGNVGSVFQFQLSADNNPGNFSLTPDLPVGLSLDSNTGLVSGVPVVEGQYSFSEVASNLNGSSQPTTISIVILPAIPVINSAVNVQAVLNQPFNYTITATGNPQVYGATPIDSSLPQPAAPLVKLPIGLTLNTTNGIISGTPNALGFYSFTVSATNGGGTGSQQLLLTVIPPLVPIISSSDVASGVANEPFSFQILANNNPLSYGIVGALPAGLLFNDQTGVISGTPLPTTVNSVAVVTKQSNGTTATLTTATPHGLSMGQTIIVALTPPDGASGNGFDGTWVVSNVGSTTSFDYTKTVSTVLAATATGGTVVSSQAYALTQTATNAAGTGNKALTITINPPATPVISSPLTAAAQVNSPFEYDIKATNHPTSFSTSALPAGLILDSTTGRISGTPTVSGGFSITISATNVGGTGSATLVLTISPQPPPVITSPNQANGFIGIPFSYQIVGTNNPQTFTAAPLPNLLTVSASGLISGTPQAGTNTVLTVTNKQSTGTTAELTTPGPHGLIVGQTVTVALAPADGAAGNGFDGTWTVTATPTPATFDYTKTISSNLAVTGTGGTVTTAKTYSVALTATNPAGTGNKTLQLTISQAAPPVITSPLPLVTGLDGAAFAYTITASGIGPITFSANPLPQGLSLVGNTIIGKPVGGNTIVTITAYSPATNPTVPGGPANPLGVPPTTAQLTIQISPTPAGITNSNLTAVGTVGQPFEYDIGTSGTTPITLTTSQLPAGLALVGNSIVGTPTSAAVTLDGPFGVTINVTNPYTDVNNPVTATLQITINAAIPKFTSSAFALGMDGVFFRYTILATGTQVISYTATGLPPGLTLSDNVISGTPTSLAVGLTTVQLVATNKGGSATLNLGIEIDPAPPVITSPATVTGAAGAPFSFDLTATGSPQIDFSIAPPANLPPGLSLNSDKITGIPTQPGTYALIVSANNPGGTDNEPLTITINPAPPIITAAQVTGSDGVPLTYQVIATGANPIAFSATGLPTGLTIDATTGIISGAPIGVGTTVATITAANAGGSASQQIIFTINPSAPHITSALIVQASPGTPFSYTIVASGTPVITYQAFNLPTGLSLNGAIISGTPTGALGTTVVTLVATNAIGSDTQTLDIVLQQSPPTISNVSLQASGQEGTPFSFQLTAFGSPTITFSATPLPNGLTLNASTGLISGTPATGSTGSYSVTVGATNAFGTAPTKTLFITITKAPPKITSVLSVSTGFGEAFTYTITATGSATITFSATNVPAGLTLNTSTGVISGVPTVAGKQVVSITATNSVGSDTQSLTITITTNPPVITSALNATASTIQGFTYTITATGQPPISFNATNLPPGLSLSGAVISGTPTVEGTYQVTLTASSPVGTDTKTLTIVVSNDADGDGVPDDLEIFLGTNPNDPNSNPFPGGIPNIGALNVQSMSVKLNLKTAGADSIQVKGTLSLAPGFSAAGKQAVTYVGGIAAKITLSSAGKGTSGTNSVGSSLNAFSIKLKATGGQNAYTFSFKKGTFAAKLATFGLTNENVLVPRAVTLPVIVLINGELYKSDKSLNYTAKAGRSGSAK
ncbi:MAG TPA: putative Ig domain-containing protein [Planctomycetota bacterium]|nr:putative Ig domain-containing protein [Planctomycetota bacterium]